MRMRVMIVMSDCCVGLICLRYKIIVANNTKKQKEVIERRKN